MSEIVGYVRTSTVDQEASFEDQRTELERAGATQVFSERVSAVASKRPQLDEAMRYIRKGDTLMVSRLDRLARSLPHLMEITTDLERRGVSLQVLDMKLDTSTPQGKLILGIFGSVAQFERELLLERQKVGIARAKAEGKYKGRKATARAMGDQIKELADQGVPKTEIATRLGIGRASVYRVLGRQTSQEAGAPSAEANKPGTKPGRRVGSN
jgi:DNA invertase Pin-like site-specific DNA recombinase